MDIALLFSGNFPDKTVAGQCYVLRRDTGTYTLGRASDGFTYDIDVQVQTFSRAQATLTFNYDAFTKSWMLSDAGIDQAGKLVPFKNGCQVNGTFVARNGRGIPDPHPIDPEFNKRILIGGDPNLKILVLPECEATLNNEVDPFDDGLWGDGLWEKVEKPKETDSELVKPFANAPTVGLNIDSIEDPRLRSFVAVSRATGHGLANPETRGQTILTLLSAAMFGFSAIVAIWILSYFGLNPFAQTPKQPPPIEAVP